MTSREIVRPRADTDILTTAVAWGHLASGTWVRIVVGTRPRKGRTLRSYMQSMAGDPGRSARVAGARGARRAEFSVELEEPVGEQRIEHVALVVAAGRHAYVTVAVSTIGEPAPGEIDAILESFRVLEV